MLRTLTICLLGLLTLFSQHEVRAQDVPRYASGIKIGEATQDSVLIWVRLTEKAKADFGRLPILTEGLPPKTKSKELMPDGDLVPGKAGWVRVSYAPEDASVAGRKTQWQPATKANDFIHQFRLSNLEPGCRYVATIEARSGEMPIDSRDVSGCLIRAKFKTAHASNDTAPVKFIVSTCQAVRSIDSGAEGHETYRHMLDFAPDFFVHTGDILYYDKVPLAKNANAARSKWHLMFAYGHNRQFHLNVSSYFMKDDHDTLKNDCWPGQKYGDLTFQQGLDIFRQQVCMGDKTYRTIRWGRDLQIWMTENRDFRSPNRMPDGPQKTILGDIQKKWLKSTIQASNAKFKFIITPGPIVGPDKKGKRDNHSNNNFSHEGQELRDFIASQHNTYVICGDRHWQYCSRDPKTGILEFGCGPINDQHDFGGTSGKVPSMHRYFSGRGGFLGVTVANGQCKLQWFQADNLKDSKPSVGHTEILK